MKRILLAPIIAVLCVSGAWAGQGLPHVSVYGTATTQVTPDEMVWSLTVKNAGGVLEDVAKRHSEVVGAVLKFLKDNGVADKRLQTARMQFGENWVYRDRSRVREGYFASTDVSFRLSDFAKYKDLWIGLATIPEVSVDSVGYDHSKRIDYQNETRQKALLAAKQKAEALAETLGSKIREPLSIEEDLGVTESWRTNRLENNISYTAGPEADAPALAPGKIPIRIRVKATFRLITPDG